MPGRLNIQNVSHRFPGQTQDLFHIQQLQLAHGTSLGIYGPSGAGKTTLLHCLAGIEQASHGSISWGDTEITRLTPRQRDRWRQEKLGLIFQDFYLIEGLSALDNVLLPASFSAGRYRSPLRTRALSLLEKVGITEPKRRAELLSRGERQRVAVARALLFQPAVVLADEPTASLDPANREIIGQLLLDMVHEHQATLLVISHEKSLLERLDQQLELKQGQLHPCNGIAHV